MAQNWGPQLAITFKHVINIKCSAIQEVPLVGPVVTQMSLVSLTTVRLNIFSHLKLLQCYKLIQFTLLQLLTSFEWPNFVVMILFIYLLLLFFNLLVKYVHFFVLLFITAIFKNPKNSIIFEKIIINIFHILQLLC